MLTLSPSCFLHSTRAYQYVEACRACARHRRSCKLRISLHLLVVAQSGLPTHLLHLLVLRVRHAHQIRAQFRGQLNEIFSVVCGELTHAHAVARKLGRQTNLAHPLQPFLVSSTACLQRPAVPPVLRAPRPAASRRPDLFEIYPMVCRESTAMLVVTSELGRQAVLSYATGLLLPAHTHCKRHATAPLTLHVPHAAASHRADLLEIYPMVCRESTATLAVTSELSRQAALSYTTGLLLPTDGDLRG